MSSIALDEYELMKDPKYRVYVSAVDKALKNFEYTSEWADLISALGKLNKVLLNHMKFPVIPRRIKISKRLAQCMHPALPSGVHLKALETYDIIFKCMGTNRLSHELFIYSAGLFPLLGNAAMNVRPSLLTVYETHFVPLGERLRPGLSGFLSGVLPGLEEGSDHFDRTNLLLEKVCDGVGAEHFYSCLWDCLASNSLIRLPAISFVLTHFNKKLPMENQLYIMGTKPEIMVLALTACVQDNSVLVQRSALDLLLIGFPVHCSQLCHNDMVVLLTAALITILRRDMSLNRRLFAWLLGSDDNISILKKRSDNPIENDSSAYFELYSKNLLIESIKATLKTTYEENPLDLRPYRILISLLDKPDIGPVILDDILYEVFRTFYNACTHVEKSSKSNEVVKSVNLLFSTLESQYIWLHCGFLYQKACQASAKGKTASSVEKKQRIKIVSTGEPDLYEVCTLTEFLLDSVSLETSIDTPTEHLPGLFHDIIVKLTQNIKHLSLGEITTSLELCAKILSKVQPPMVTIAATQNHDSEKVSDTKDVNSGNSSVGENNLIAIPLEKSQSDTRLNKSESKNLSAEKISSPRRRANSSGAAKKSDKRAKKKMNKNSSKINDMFVPEDTSNILVVINDESKPLSRNKSMDNLKINYVEHQDEKTLLSLKSGASTESLASRNSINSLMLSPSRQAQCSMLEKCLRSYERFYVKLVEGRMLEQKKSASELFEELTVSTPQENINEHMQRLEDLLMSKIDEKDSTTGISIGVTSEEKNVPDVTNLSLLTISCVDEWQEVLKTASSLLVDLSTFPTYCSQGDGIITDEVLTDHLLPEWLKVLVVCSCWLTKQPSLQLISIATLLDLIALFKAHSDSKSHSLQSGEGITTVVMMPLLKQWHLNYLHHKTNVFHILSHSLWRHLGELPPHKYRIWCVELLYELHYALNELCDIVEDVIGSSLSCSVIEKRIEAFNRFIMLWHLGRDVESNNRSRGYQRTFDKSLLKVLDNLQLADNSPLKLQAQSWLIHSLARGDVARVLTPILQILLEPTTCRMSVLHVNIQHSNVILTKGDTTEEKAEAQDENEAATNIYAISSVDGNVIYHVSNGPTDHRKSRLTKLKKKKQSQQQPSINPVKVKRIFAVTTLATGGNNKLRYITEKNQSAKELEVPPSISGNRKISVFINPLSMNCNHNSNDSLTEDETTSLTNKKMCVDLLKNVKRFNKLDIDSTASLDDNLFEALKVKDKREAKKTNGEVDSSFESIDNSFDSSSPEVTEKFNKLKKELNISHNSREIPGTLTKGKYRSSNEFTSGYDMHDVSGSYDANSEVPSWTMGDEEGELEISTTAEEYFNNSNTLSIVESILSEVIDKAVQVVEHTESTKSEDSIPSESEVKRNGVGVHNLHSHMLLYCGVYDSTRSLYALSTLRNEIQTNPRMFLFSVATTGISNNAKNTLLINLLGRHRKSVFGRNFHGDITNTEFISMYRSSMYLEVLISVCLYFARSYYPNLGQMRLTQEEISGNRQVQLASVELLTLIFSELIPIVRDSGKGFSCYIMDLLTKCKVQKVALHCLASSVLSMKSAQKEYDEVFTFTEEIVLFNDPVIESDTNKCKYRASDHTEAFQIQLLRLLSALIMLENQCALQKGEDVSTSSTPTATSPNRTNYNLSANNLKYIPGLSIPQQSMFITSILSALKLNHMRHLHQYWTNLVTSSLPFMGSALAHIMTSVIHQLCNNIEHLASYYVNNNATMQVPKLEDLSLVECCLPADYTVTHLEALTYLLHYCLLDTSQQSGFSFNQPLSGAIQTGIPSSNPGQIFNNLIHVFMPGPLSPDICTSKDKNGMNEQLLNARRTALSHLPRIIASLSALWQAVLAIKDNEQASCVVGNPRVVKHQLLELLSPISFHHGVNFLAAVAVAWHERRQPMNSKKILPEACPNQQVMVHLVGAIRVMPIDTLVQTVHQVIKTLPPTQGVKQDFSLEVSVLELLYVYMQSNASQTLVESWTSMLGLLKEGLSLSAPAQFLLLAILNEYVQKCPPMQEKKDIKDLQDISAKLIESCSQIAGACLEQTTWLRRNLAVREDVLDVAEGSNESKEIKNGTAASPGTPPNTAYSVQAQAVLAEILAPLLDVSYGSQEKERVATLLINLMYNVTPYLKNHTTKNIASFTACSQLLSSLSGYQYTRKAWRKDVLDLLLDPAFFQMTPACLPYWRTIIDNLMTHDNTTFRDLLNKVSIAQSSSINLFSSKEQEYEQRSQLLKRLAFVILCSEADQYHKYMPEIQERLAESLRLPQVIPSIQAQVFLCFRVLLLRMSPQHTTSLWPVIVSELVQVFLHIEQELTKDSEEFSSHIKLMSVLDSSWASNVSNGLQAHGHPHWMQLQLAAAKLLDLALLLPAHRLPQFQMYKWAFVGGAANNTENNNLSSDFIPHVTRIVKLMDSKFKGAVTTTHIPPGELILLSNTLTSLQDLHVFFTILSCKSRDTHALLNTTQVETVIEQDFLEKMPNVPAR